MKRVELNVKEREITGSPEMRRMRKQGWIPAVLYGGDHHGVPLSIEEKTLRQAIGHERGTVILNLTFEGGKKGKPALIKDSQVDPITGNLLHLDFIEVKMNKPIESVVHIELAGQAVGVRDGGIMDHAHREVHIRSLPNDIPPSIACDVESLKIGDSLRVGDLQAPEGVEILDDPEIMIASVMAPKISVEVTAEETGAAEEGTQPAEGAAPAAEGEAGAEA